jgi:glycosyltransferase involved in cell wall biosynthesis
MPSTPRELGRNGPIRFALFAAAPMYYHAPVYKLLARHPAIEFTAIFASDVGIRPHDPGYSREIVWDVDALEGYRAIFLRRAARNPVGRFGPLSLCDPDVVPTVLNGRFEVLWLHGYNSITHLLAVAAQRLRRGQLLFREEQTLLHPRPPWKVLVKEVALRVLFARAFAVYIGTENRRWFEHYGIDDGQLFFSPYCVDNDRLQETAAHLKSERLILRRRFGIDDAAGPVILSVSRFIPKKQPEFLLEAFKRVRAKRRCVLLLVGSGALESSLRAKVKEDKIQDVVFAGFLNQSDVGNAYACADVFALVSREHETWGLAVNEAMNFALPVVVSDAVGCHTDLVHAGETGFVVGREDVQALERVLLTLVTSFELRERMGAEALRRVSQWSVDEAVNGVIDAVAAAVGSDRWKAALAHST